MRKDDPSAGIAGVKRPKSKGHHRRLHGLKKGGMRRLAEAGNTIHELMAISGHPTLSEVQRNTAEVDRKKLADSGMKKKREGENKNADVSNLPPSLVKYRLTH